MKITTTFRDMATSPALEAAAQQAFERLLNVSPRIVGGHVTIEKPHRHQQHGSPFHVGIVLTVPGGQIAVTRQEHEDAYVALADAFRAARRQLLDHADLQQSFVKDPMPDAPPDLVSVK